MIITVFLIVFDSLSDLKQEFGYSNNYVQYDFIQ